METRAPAVVAVVVTTGSAPGLEATLSSLSTQSYEELSLLVIANGPTDNVAERVAAIAPTAFVRTLDENVGFAAACNEAAVMVEGSAFFLFCHDDVRLDSDAVQLLVEAAYRTNAGIVSPKVVSYEDNLVLVHVGQTCDRFGVVRDRVEPGEIDHGQQDLERDVFVAPGGVTLVRADLFATLRGFDPLITALGEDLDLSWRAQVAGARIVVAPAARVAHRETVATGERRVNAIGSRGASRQTLQRRHQLLVVAAGWSRGRSASTLLLLLAMDAMELVLALVGRDHDRASAIVGSWRWLLVNRKRIGERRRNLNAIRVLSDDELQRLQIGGASRLKRFFVVLVRDGLESARGLAPDKHVLEPAVIDDASAGVGFASAFAEDESFDEGLGTTVPTGSRPSRFLTTFRSQALVIALVALLWLIGARDLVATHLPLIGRLTPLDSWWGTWRHFFASWSPNGVGTGTPGMPGYGLLAFAGTFVFGRMGILPRLALIGAVPLGAMGMSRLLKGRVSNRARVIGVIAYMALPMGVNMIAQGRIDVLLVSAGLPFIVRRLGDLLALPGMRSEPYPEPVPFGHHGWRVTEAGQRMSLYMLVAVVSAFAPATVVAVALVILGAALAQRMAGEPSTLSVPAVRLLGAVVVNVAIFLLPMTVDTLLAGRRAFEVFGLLRGAGNAPSWAHLLQGADGVLGGSWTGWLLPGVGFLAVLLARRERFVWASFAGLTAMATLLLITVSDHHWLGNFAPDLDVLLVLYGTLIAVLVAVCVSAIENDLRVTGFGWRQISSAVAVGALVVSVAPFAGLMTSGRFTLPTTSVAESLSSLHPSTAGGYRVLWLGDPSVMPLGGWNVVPGLEATTTTNGLPNGSTLFTPPTSGAADAVLTAVREAVNGQTVSLGSLLAPAGISAIVVVNAQAPQVPGQQTSIVRPATAAVIAALNAQTGLALELSSPSDAVYANVNYTGLYSEGLKKGSQRSIFSAARPAGPVQPGDTVRIGLAPASAFSLDVNGRPAPRSTTAGWAPTYYVGTSARHARATVTLHQFPLNGLLAFFTLGLWLIMWLGFGLIARLEWLFTARRRTTGSSA